MITYEEIPKLIIELDSPISQLHKYLAKEYLKAGIHPLEATITLENLFNGDSQRLTNDFGLVIKDEKYLYRLWSGNLHENIKLGFIELYCNDLLNELKE